MFCKIEKGQISRRARGLLVKNKAIKRFNNWWVFLSTMSTYGTISIRRKEQQKDEVFVFHTTHDGTVYLNLLMKIRNRLL